jgi:hypothetical protein
MIATAHDTAILFDHRTGTAKLVPFDGELETLYSLLKVDLVDTIRLDPHHIVFVDDEGYYKQYETGFLLTYKGRQVKFVGSGLLVGDAYGENAPLNIKFNDLKIDVLKLTYEIREETKEEEGL